MAFIIAVVSLVILTILYRLLIKAERPSPIGMPQAVVPVVLGVVSLGLSFVLVMGINRLLTGIGFTTEGMPLAVRSILNAFFLAGLNEEIAKLLMIAVTLIIFRGKVRNVYEYILIGAAVGIGFTIFEEFLYGSGDMTTAIGRLITLAAHMIFGIIMGRHLGLAKHCRKTGRGSAAVETVKAILIPMAIHTVYDAFTANNMYLASEEESASAIGGTLSIACIIALFVMQIVVIRRTIKRAEQYSAMDV